MQKIEIYSGPVAFPKAGPSGGTVPGMNGNISVGVASGILGNLISGGVAGFPVFRGAPGGGGDLVFPRVVILSVVGTAEVRTAYNQTPVTGATPLGDMVPQQPAALRIPFPEAITNNLINIIASVAATVVTWRIEY